MKRLALDAPASMWPADIAVVSVCREKSPFLASSLWQLRQRRCRSGATSSRNSASSADAGATAPTIKQLARITTNRKDLGFTTSDVLLLRDQPLRTCFDMQYNQYDGLPRPSIPSGLTHATALEGHRTSISKHVPRNCPRPLVTYPSCHQTTMLRYWASIRWPSSCYRVLT